MTQKVERLENHLRAERLEYLILGVAFAMSLVNLIATLFLVITGRIR